LGTILVRLEPLDATGELLLKYLNHSYECVVTAAAGKESRLV